MGNANVTQVSTSLAGGSPNANVTQVATELAGGAPDANITQVATLLAQKHFTDELACVLVVA